MTPGKLVRRAADTEADGGGVTGVAVRYGTPARVGGGLEAVEAGAFGNVDGLDVTLNRQHRREAIIGRTAAGLTLTDTPEALAFDWRPVTRAGREAMEDVEAGLLRGASIEFVPRRVETVGGVAWIRAADLIGISLVDTPAYPSSSLSARWRPWL